MSLDNLSQVETIHASQDYVWRKSRWLIFSLPVVLYAFLAAIHYLLGFDLTGGWMGSPNYHPAHLTVLLVSPILFFLLLRAVRGLWFHRPVYVQLSAEKLRFVFPNRKEYTWDSVVDVSVTQDRKEITLRVRRPSGETNLNISIPDSHLYEPMESLIAQFEARGTIRT